MAREFTRSDRVSDFLRQELAQLIQQEIRDPRIGMVMVTSVDVSRDIHYAKVFVTIVGVDSKEDSAEAIDALNNAAGFFTHSTFAPPFNESDAKAEVHF
jgi:ribosome-binding factor A